MASIVISGMADKDPALKKARYFMDSSIVYGLQIHYIGYNFSYPVYSY